MINSIIKLLSFYSKYNHCSNDYMYLYFDNDYMIRIIDLIGMEEVDVITTGIIYSETDFIEHINNHIKSSNGSDIV